MGCVAQSPLDKAVPAHVGHPVDLRDHIVECKDEAPLAFLTTLSMMANLVCDSPGLTMSSAQLSTPMSNCFTAPGSVLVNTKALHRPKVSDPSSLHGLDELAGGFCHQDPSSNQSSGHVRDHEHRNCPCSSRNHHPESVRLNAVIEGCCCWDGTHWYTPLGRR